MNRDQLIRALKAYCRKRELHFLEDRKKGKGSHYRVEVGDKWTTVQSDLNPGKIRTILKQLGVDPADL
ncbi:MAG: hypothetical protein EOP24_27755 [Hyphomicrobiales bacterium]|nr:MAG: hypothetical protein EOP24_27755 [Hyphomicrobiales bacterium]